MFDFLVYLAVLLTVSDSQIRSNENNSVGYGEDAVFKCEMDDAKGVQQVMWQQTRPDHKELTIASYSERFGEKVNKEYIDKVVFTEASLSSPSITVKNITWRDECCYVCWFNAFPDGSMKGQSCVSVEGISAVDLVTHKSRTDRSWLVDLSCSATGKPTPVIQWKFPTDIGKVEGSNDYTLKNADHTWTSSSNITLEVPLDWTGHVDCVVNHGMKGEQEKRMSFSSSESYNVEEDEEFPETQNKRVGIIVSLSVILLVLPIVALMVMKCGAGPPRLNYVLHHKTLAAGRSTSREYILIYKSS